MKNIPTVSLLILLLFQGCVPMENSRLEGAWQLVEAKYIDGTAMGTAPDNLKGSQIKIWSADHWACIGQLTHDSITTDNYAGGTYSFSDNRYSETIEYHVSRQYVGRTVSMLLELKGNTLTQIWPVDDYGHYNSSRYNMEKYIRF